VAGWTTASGAVGETAGVTGSVATDSASGSIAFADVDVTDLHTAAPSFDSAVWRKSGGATATIADPGSLSLGTVDDVAKTVGWTYNVTDGALDFLAAGETLTVTVSDGQGGSVPQDVTVTITGTNDQPVITSGAQTGSITELTGQTGSTSNDTAMGAVTFTDADLSDTHTLSVTGVTISGTTSGLPGNATLLSWLTLGTLTDSTNGATGSDGWTFSAQDKNFDYLAAGQTVTLTYAVQIAETHGGSISQNVVVTIVGTNDTPVITSSAQTGSITELAGQIGSTTNDTANGAVTFTDADFSDTHTVTVTGATASGTTSGLPANATLLT
jgi:VCBS repeat-containing protein